MNARPAGYWTPREVAMRTLLMCHHREWSGYAQQPLSKVPAEIQRQALTFFTARRSASEVNEPNNFSGRAKLTRQIEALTEALAPRFTAKTVRFDLLDEMGEEVIKENVGIDALFDTHYEWEVVARVMRQLNAGEPVYEFYQEEPESKGQLCLLRVIA